MNIGIDCGAVAVKDERLKTGVYQITRQLLKQLSALDKKNIYWLYSFAPIDKNLLNELGNNFVNKILIPQTGWLSVRLSLEILLNKPDVFIALNQALPLYHPQKTLVFIYDLAYDLYPDCYQDSASRLSRLTKKAVSEASKIITISNSTKNDLMNLYGVNKENINVIYPGIEEIFRPKSNEEVQSVKTKYGLPGHYLLFVGSLKPIKNINKIIDGYELLPEDLKNKFKLVAVGSDYWTDNTMKEKMAALVEKKQLYNLGYVPREDLPALYTGASVFLSPSLYEGFGLPLLEAMACGCPAITSLVGSMPEVVGNAGILTDPTNNRAISESIKEVVTNDALRKSMREKSITQAKKFSWESFGKTIYTIIEEMTSDKI